MTPHQFLSDIVKPNFAELHDSPNDLRLAINAVLSVDAYVGAYFLSPNNNLNGCKTDGKLRDQLSQKSQAFQITIDLAASLKHGELTRKDQSRSVSHCRMISSNDLVWDDAEKWFDAALWLDTVILIEYNAAELKAASSNKGIEFVRAYDVLSETVDFLSAELIQQNRKSRAVDKLPTEELLSFGKQKPK